MTRLLSISAAALLTLALSCSPAHWAPPPAPVAHPPPLGYSNPMAFAQVGGRAKLYVPRAYPGVGGAIAVVDLATPGRGTRGAGALLGTVALPVAGEYATLVSGDDRVLVAASSDFPKAWIIDPATDAVTGEIPLTGLGFSSFGGLDAYVTAVIVDPDRNRAWLAVWNGYAAIDLARGQRVASEDVLTAPSEAPGYDPVRGLIYSPFYDCAAAHGPTGATPPPCASYTSPGGVPMPAGLNVIRVSDRTVYTLQRPGPFAAAPVGSQPDAAAIDGAAGLAFIADEATPAQLVLDFSAASFDDAARTVQLPDASHLEIAGAVYPGTATDPASGTVLLADEYSSLLAFSTSADLKAGRQPTRAELPLLPLFPAGEVWATAGDPHGAAMVVVDGKRYAVLVREFHDWVARIDLDKVDAISPANPTALSAAELAPAVTYLDLTRAP